MTGFVLREGGLDHPAVVDLLAYHHRTAHAAMPPGYAYALDLAGLQAPEVSFWTLWDGDAPAGIGALRTFSENEAEIKSMRTAPTHLRRGVARALLTQLLALARERGHAQVSLETGTGPSFDAAGALYEAFGFVDCPAFGGYRPSPHNRYMTLTL